MDFIKSLDETRSAWYLENWIGVIHEKRIDRIAFDDSIGNCLIGMPGERKMCPGAIHAFTAIANDSPNPELRLRSS